MIAAEALRVTRARLHPSSGRLALRGEVEVSGAGPHRIEIELDAGARLETLEARARRADGERIEVAWPSSELPTPAASTSRRSEALTRRRDALEQIAALAVDRLRLEWARPEPPLEAWTRFFARYRDLRAQLETEARREAAIIEANAARPSARLELQLPELAAPEAIEIEIELWTEAAGWRPSVELDVRAIERGAAELTWRLAADLKITAPYRWIDTELTLEDVEAPRPGPLPELRRVVVSGFQGAPLGRALREDEQLGPIPPPAPARRFRPPAPVSVEPGPRSTRVGLLERRSSAAIVDAVDLEGPSAARCARGRPPFGLGPAELWISCEGVDVGRVPVPGLHPEHDLELELQDVEGLRLTGARRRHPPRRSRGTNRLEHRFEIELELEDAGAGPIDLELRGRLPVAGSDDVEIEIHELPEACRVDPETGALDALLRLGAGARRSWRAAFSVHAPRSVVVDDPEDA